MGHMGNLEALASSGNLLHVALEARSALTDVNLLHTLQDLGHPYGLMLSQLSQTPSSRDVISSSQFLSQSSSQFPQFLQNSEPIQIESNHESGFFHSITHPLTLYLFGQESSSSELLSEGLSSSGSSLTIFELFPQPQERHPEIYSHKIRLGTVSLNLAKFRGQEPFTVKSPQGEPVAEIQPGSPLAFSSS